MEKKRRRLKKIKYDVLSGETHFAGQQFLELFDGFGDGERVEERLSAGHRAHGHVAHSHIIFLRR